MDGEPPIPSLDEPSEHDRFDDDEPAPGLIRAVLMPSPALAIFAVATAALWVGVLVTTGGGAPPEATPVDPSIAVGSAPLSDVDAKAEAVITYFEARPGEFERGRALVAERLATPTSPAMRTRLEEAAKWMEARFEARAAAMLSEKSAAAQALRDKGDLAGMKEVLLDWPETYRASAKAKEAATLAETWRAESMAPGAALLADGPALLAKWDSLGEHAVDDARDYLARVAAYGKAFQGDAAQRAQVEAVRVEVAKRLEASLRANRGPAVIAALSKALGAAEAKDPDGVRAALEKIASESAGASEAGDLVAEVVGRGKEVEKALKDRLARLEKGNWAAILDGRLFAGAVGAAPSPRTVFAPGWKVESAGGAPVPEFGDLFAVEPDRERAASWLVLTGQIAAAFAIAPPNGRARAMLIVGAAASRPLAPPTDGAWADLLRQSPSLLRPAAALGARPSTAKGSPAAATALAAILKGDWAGAWKSLEEATKSAPGDAEVISLKSRVLDALAEPLPTLGASLTSLVEARRAWDLDPGLPATSLRMAEASLRFFRRHPGPLAEALKPVALSACEEAARLGQPSAAILLHAGESRLAEGKPKDALPLVRRAAHEAPDDAAVALLLARVEDAAGDPKKALQALEKARKILGPEFPEWAQTMLEHLTRR